VLLECIYYLPQSDWGAVIEHLVNTSGRADVFLSCPVTGHQYPTEGWLAVQFGKLDYRCADAQALNFRPPWGLLLDRLGPKVASLAAVRRNLGHQVIYCFKSIADGARSQLLAWWGVAMFVLPVI